MKVHPKAFHVRELNYIIRSAKKQDAQSLSELRLQIDGETENMDRERGESYIDAAGFKHLINEDTISPKNLFLVCETDSKIVGFSRCEGNPLKRSSHKVEFGVCVLKDFWGYSIGKNLLKESILWSDTNDIKKMTLSVLESNKNAITLYKNNGFEIEGLLKKDKLLSDGKFYNTIIMGRIKDQEF
ncbi:GNAT family N-acetyltransferase [Sutcliffiella rhizosphaerae]|uniref:L-amino acid N-acetyltransferase AaaT n=1 Tax=Sutcliffiella rhizosphaerae TaxID=2880967 RepID=A0ABN8AHE4_9BACI|nr:GNAT family N-acetyltransferase [Sutcliffiella rhizosphaerae]CAG9622927.1 L-amino acid N-acetyltransferase AaaT [Sutcliffiella rhizosphaerae]